MKFFPESLLKHWNKIGLAGLVTKVSGAIAMQKFPWLLEQPAEFFGISVAVLSRCLVALACLGALGWIAGFIKNRR